MGTSIARERLLRLMIRGPVSDLRQADQSRDGSSLWQKASTGCEAQSRVPQRHRDTENSYGFLCVSNAVCGSIPCGSPHYWLDDLVRRQQILETHQQILATCHEFGVQVSLGLGARRGR